MTSFIEHILEASICFTVFISFYGLFLKDQANHSLNRFYLLLSPIIALLLPFSSSIFTVHAGNSVVFLNEVSIETAKAKSLLSDNISLMNIALWLYISGMIIAFSLLAVKVFRIIFLIRQAEVTDRGNYKLVKTPHPVEAGSFFNYVFNVNESEAIILEHELVHSRQWHSLDLIIIELLKSILWFHPVIYLTAKELKITHEFIADRVASSTIPISKYGNLLINKELHPIEIPMMNQFFQNNIKRRIMMLPKQPIHISALTFKISGITLMLLSMVFIFSCQKNEGNKQEAQSSTKEETAAKEAPEQQPEYPGGIPALMQFIGSHVQYPKEEKEAGVEGLVVVEFVVEEDGSVGEAAIEKSVSPALDAEALRVVNELPNFAPGQSNGKNVRTKMYLPIRFKLDKEE